MHRSNATRTLGYLTAVLAFAHAGVSVFWGLGGRWLLDRVGADAVELLDAGDTGAQLAVWGAAVAKALAGVIPLAMISLWGARFPRRILLLVGWGSAIVLMLYGGAQVFVQTLVRTGVITPEGEFDQRAMDGHLYVWAPWFFTWGVAMAITTLLYARDSRSDRGSA